MSQDVEMKERRPVLSKAVLVAGMKFDVKHLTLETELTDIAVLLVSGANANDVSKIMRALRRTYSQRYKLEALVLSRLLKYWVLQGSEAHSLLTSLVSKEDVHKMAVLSSLSSIQVPAAAKHLPLLPELEIYCYLLVLMFLIKRGRNDEAKICSSTGIARLRSFNKITVDITASRLYFYYSLSHELTGSLADIRGNLLALYQTATLHRDDLGKEILLNLLLRNYLHYNLYDQAEKLRSMVPRFESQSTLQLCRYLFYLGKIRTIRLEYTDAEESLLQAARKAPVSAYVFRILCNKWAVIVRLLLGEIPERAVFMQEKMKRSLHPYFEITNAVRIGDLELFKSIAEKFSDTFSRDRTNNLIVRLRHNVIRTGLRNISISYSRISLVDVAKKLRFNSADPVADVESIISKAIRDGAIDATLDHANGWMLSKKTRDIYSTNEPQTAFHSRITLCLNMHNEAVRALRYPPNWHERRGEIVEEEFPEYDGEFWL